VSLLNRGTLKEPSGNAFAITRPKERKSLKGELKGTERLIVTERGKYRLHREETGAFHCVSRKTNCFDGEEKSHTKEGITISCWGFR